MNQESFQEFDKYLLYIEILMAHACRIFATTPGDLSDKKRCQSALRIVEDALEWDERFYDMKLSEFKQHVQDKSNYLVVYIEYDYKQLGLGEDWFRKACSNVGNNVSKIRREILLQRFTGNSLSPFSEEDIIELGNNKQKPVYTQTIGSIYDLRFYIKPEDLKRKRMHFISIDPSDGTGNDNYAITVLDPYDLKVTMEFKSQYMSPKGCRELVEYMVHKYFPKCLIIIENNRNGTTLIDYFKESWLKPYIYASSKATGAADLLVDEYDHKGFIKDELMRRKFSGVKTDQTTRPMMMSILVDAVKFRKDILTSEYLVEDINNLILKGERIEAAPGEHDDMVMSWCLAMWVYYYGEKLERYGFHKGELPDDITQDDEFIRLQALYANPEIQKKFPTMYTFYQNQVQTNLEKEHNERIARTIKSTINDNIGSIQQQIIRSDPEYANAPLTPQVSQEDSDWRTNIVSKWKSLNR